MLTWHEIIGRYKTQEKNQTPHYNCQIQTAGIDRQALYCKTEWDRDRDTDKQAAKAND